MIIRRNDENNDWTFGYSQVEYLTESNAIALDIKTDLQEWKNNCIFAMDKGIDYKIRLGYKGQKNLLDMDIKKIITDNENVVSLNSFESTVNDREYTATFSYTDIYSNEVKLTTGSSL